MVKRARRKAKGKGSAFERKVCKQLSLWVSKGRRTDLFWRTAMSGGRATVARKKGVVVRQGGDICSVDPGGHVFTDSWYIECKHYRRIDLAAWLVNNEGKLVGWWKKCRQEARMYGREPLLIVKQNFYPVLVITRIGELERYTSPQLTAHNRNADISYFDDMILEAFG